MSPKEPPFRIEVTDRRAADGSRVHVKIGNRFVFTDGGAQQKSGRLARLLGRGGADGRRRVYALAREAVELDGFRVHPAATEAEPLHALVTDRDLYRAEEDTVSLFLAMPAPPDDLKLVVELAGDVFTERALNKRELPSLAEHGVHIEPLSMLLAGDYTAQLAVGDKRIGQPVSFTVAEYTLAPLTGRLLAHSLDRGTERLSFSLAVESYEQPFDRALRVELLAGATVVDSVELEPVASGRYEGALAVSGDQALRLRLIGKDDAERTCDVIIPGSRKRERQASIVSELGNEKLLSLMPEPGALSLRGAYLSDGDFLGTPVVVDEIVTARGRFEVRGTITSFTTVLVDLASGKTTVTEHGDKSSGDVVELAVPGAACTVFVGGFAGDRPFEGFTHLFRPASLELNVAARHDPANRSLVVKVSSSDHKRRPVLLCVRDERLTATDTPEVALSASVKRGIEAQTQGFGDDWQLTDLGQGEPWSWLKLGLKPIDLDTTVAVPDLLQRLPWQLAEHLRVVPAARAAGKVIVATSQPESQSVTGTMSGIFYGEDVELRFANDAAIGRFLTANRAQFPVMPPMPSGAVNLSGARSSVPQASAMRSGRGPMRSRHAAPVDALREIDGVNDDDMYCAFDGETAAEGGAFFDEPTGAPMAKDRMAEARLVEAPQKAKKGARKQEALPSTSAAPGQAILDKAAPTEEAAPATERTMFPEVIFYGLVDVTGDATIELPLADALGTFTLEVFALADGDWARTKETVIVDQPVRVDLDVPPAVFAGDHVTASLRGAASSGQAIVSLLCDGEPVLLLAADGAALPAGAVLPSPVEARFAVRPGQYTATVEDAATGERDTKLVIVSEPGELRSYAKEVGFLQPGEHLNLFEAGDDVLSLRVLPGLKETTKCLVQATAGYGHMCCEQTAAKILSATAMYLSAEDKKTKAQAEKIILAGIAREKKMHLQGRGFSMYPGDNNPNDYWGQQAVRHLWRLSQLQGVDGLSRALATAVAEGVAMATDAGAAYRVERVPTSLSTLEEAYLVATGDAGRLRDAAQWARGAVVIDDGEPRLKDPRGAAHNRSALSYAAAVLLMAGELKDGVRLADVVLRQLNEAGRLYSTFDSVAAIALMIELERAGVGRGDGEVTVNGKKMTFAAASELSDQIETIEVHKGVCAIELSAIRTESWSAFASSFGVRVGFRDSGGAKKRAFRQGDRAELVVELQEDYQAGDLVHVALPAALSWLKGGGRVQRFTVDFEGQREVRVPLLVTGRIEGQQRFAVCVRNMFEEERASNPGLLTVQAA